MRARRQRGEAGLDEWTTAALYGGASLENARTFAYVQHPAPDGGGPREEAPALPVHLTDKERKRVRRQARQEREREKQDKIALGLLPAAEPKMKLSNFMKVLGEQAVADPSKVERLVMQQIGARKVKHEMANLARALTPEERRAKKARRLQEDTSQEVHVAVFRVALAALEDPRHRFKVDKNAQQWYMTGAVLACKAARVGAVVVEGGPKAIKYYTRLMLRRIQWGAGGNRGPGGGTGGGSGGGGDDSGNDSGDDAEDDEGDGVGGGGGDGIGMGTYGETAGARGASATFGGGGSATFGNAADDDANVPLCELVWQGVVKQRGFNAFRFQECTSAETARKVMAQRGVPHYWDLCLLRGRVAGAAIGGPGTSGDMAL
ncbi:unnamed protein product [Phaeothamnion confervicola]